MTARVALFVALFVAASLAGCSGSGAPGAGAGASDAVAGADDAAADLADDAVLLETSSTEVNADGDLEAFDKQVADGQKEIDAAREEDPEGAAEDDDIAAYETYAAHVRATEFTRDAHLMDGATNGWLSVYYSPSKQVVRFVAVDGVGNVVSQSDLQVSDEEAADVEEFVAGVAEQREQWAIDASEAAAAIVADNRTKGLAEALLLNGTHVYYSLDLDELEWFIGVFQPNVGTLLAARVNATDGTISDLNVYGMLSGGEESIERVIPDPIHEKRQVGLSVDPLNVAGFPICTSPTAACYATPFTALNDVHFEGSLSWDIVADDFDLYIVDAAGTVIVSPEPVTVPTGVETIEGELPAGEYNVVVVGWLAVSDTYTLDVQFS